MKNRLKKALPTNNRGVALLLAVTVVSLLVAVTVQFNRDMRHELTSSANLLASSRLSAMVKSGYNLGVAVLELDGAENDYDSYHDAWARLQGDSTPSLYGSGRVDVAVADLGGRLQVNSLVDVGGGQQQDGNAQKNRDILRRLLLYDSTVERSEEEAELIIFAIVDWIDADDKESGIEETESSFYQSLDPGYACRNGPLEFIEELLLIRGITADLYYGTEESAGLRELLTVHGDDSKININTAPPAIIRALSPALNEELVEELLFYRQEEGNKDRLQSPGWYANILPGDIVFEGDIIGTSSRYFEVVSAAEYSGREKSLRAVVRREQGKQPEMISRKVE
ncbi:MAG TPA: type II secretion system minor pseudopilin GspK [Desulfopila sp.]|nr:type II secretion system minor pseudopilin GspK [Desulfopila sp.]